MSDPEGLAGHDAQSDRLCEPGGCSPPKCLRHLAFYGHRDHVRALFERLPPADRGRHAHPEILRQVVEGSLARARALRPGTADLRAEHEFLESVVQLFVCECTARQAFPRQLFRSLLDWSDELIRASRLADAHTTCTLALTLGVHAFPELWPWVRLRLARSQMLLGDFDAAHTTLLGTYQRLDRIADRNAVPALLDALCTISLQTKQAPLFLRLLAARLRVFHTSAGERRAAVDLTRRAHRGILGLIASSELSSGDKLLWLTYWLCLGAAGRVSGRRLAGLLERCAAGTAYMRQYGVRSAGAAGSRTTAAPIAATLVTRAMGGIGDLLMMTPGLRALKAMRPHRRIVLAIPRRFFPLFDGNDDVELIDIDGDLDPAAYPEWFNLTDCPAARIESRTAPAVRKNRIELFARGLGITGWRLKTMDRRPRYVVSAAELKWRDEFFVRHGLDSAFVVGVQPRTDEAYRDVPHIRQIIGALTEHARVVVFGDRLPPGGAVPGAIHVAELDLRRSFALASGCQVLVTPDSAFFHVAAALDVPCVGLFGPTDGRVRGRDYPRSTILDARRTLRCVPCWRNETTPCSLTGLRPSVCLGEISPVDVVRAVGGRAGSGPWRLSVAG